MREVNIKVMCGTSKEQCIYVDGEKVEKVLAFTVNIVTREKDGNLIDNNVILQPYREIVFSGLFNKED